MMIEFFQTVSHIMNSCSYQYQVLLRNGLFMRVQIHERKRIFLEDNKGIFELRAAKIIILRIRKNLYLLLRGSEHPPNFQLTGVMVLKSYY